jgi:hypothetical protein
MSTILGWVEAVLELAVRGVKIRQRVSGPELRERLSRSMPSLFSRSVFDLCVVANGNKVTC